MPKKGPHDISGRRSHLKRPHRYRSRSLGEPNRLSPLAAAVRDTRIWKSVMDRMDIQCDDLYQLRRMTNCRFLVTTTDDIMAGVTEVLDRANSKLESG